MSGNPLQDAFNLFSNGKLNEQNEEQLNALYQVCVNCNGYDAGARSKADLVSKAILQRLDFLQSSKKHNESIGEQKLLHQIAIDQSKGLHAETMAEIGKLHQLIEELKEPHLIERRGFWISFWVLIVAALTLIIALLSWRFPIEPSIPSGTPAILTTNSVAAPTSLPPVKPAIQAASQFVPPTQSGTNQIAK